MTEVRPSRPGTETPTVPSNRRILGYALIILAVALAPILAWKLADVLLLAFGAVLIATLIELVAEPLIDHTPVPRWLSILFAGLLIVTLVATVGWLFGSRLFAQFTDLVHRSQAASGQIKDELNRSELGRYALGKASDASISITALGERLMSMTFSFFEASIILVISAVYLVAQPRTYRRGLVLLLAPDERSQARRTLEEVGQALRLWLIGQLIQMAIIGLLSTAATWALGVPSPLALGAIATLTEFVPYLGPILAAVPALLLALTKSPSLVLWTLGAYLVIHQIEGNIITPLVQRWLIVIPPAVMLLGIAASGTLFGLLGIIFAGPLVAVIYVAVRTLWVRDTLGQPL